MTRRSGLVLFAHGARDPRWATPFEAVVARVRAQRPDTPVQLAFLELMTPNLADAVQALVGEGCDAVEVLPLFLGTGGHLRRDLPALIEPIRAAHPGLTITLHAAAGEQSEVIDAMAATAIATLRP